MTELEKETPPSPFEVNSVKFFLKQFETRLAGVVDNNVHDDHWLSFFSFLFGSKFRLFFLPDFRKKKETVQKPCAIVK